MLEFAVPKLNVRQRKNEAPIVWRTCASAAGVFCLSTLSEGVES